MSKQIALNNGLKIGTVGLGTWKSTNEEVKTAVEVAIDCGYRHIDCAWEYGNEEAVGKAIQNKLQDNTITREELFVTSKLWNDHHEVEHVRSAFMESLNWLKLEYLDLYLMHFPTGYKKEKKEDGDDIYSEVDYMTTWKEMEKLVDDGLVRSIGVSNFNQYQLGRVLRESRIRPQVNQIEVHPYLPSIELVEFCQRSHVTVTAFSPFASPDRSWAPPDEVSLLDEPALVEMGKEVGSRSPAHIVLRYLIQRGLVVIPKSKTPERIRSNIQVFDFELSSKQMNSIASLDKNFRALALEYDLPHKYYPWKENYCEEDQHASNIV